MKEPCEDSLNINKIEKIYRKKKSQIKNRLEDFKKIWDSSDEDIFSELCFCILTPQSKALVCYDIIRGLKKNRLLFDGKLCSIRPHVKRARFYKNKSRYIIEARALLRENGRIKIKNRINKDDVLATREWLAKDIKGIGYKEASHFLRNIGMGEDLAILDVHILKNLKKLGVIKDIPKSINRKLYLEIEEKLREFSGETKIPLSHLDLLFWSMETGKIFK